MYKVVQIEQGRDKMQKRKVNLNTLYFSDRLQAELRGIGQTRFVMLQGIAGAFGVRVPVSYLISRTANATLFHIGLATPLSSIVQLLLCLGFMVYLKRKKPEQTVQ